MRLSSKNYGLLLLVLLGFTSKAQTPSLCQPKVASYYYGVEDLPIRGQVKTLFDLGLNGIMLNLNQININELNQYYNTPLIKQNKFHVYDVWLSIPVDNSKALPNAYSLLKNVYTTTKDKGTIVQVIFTGESTKNNINKIVREAADIAAENNTDLVIYPHFGHTIATAEIALEFIESSKRDNVYLALHLCHELRAKNEDRISEIVNKVAPYVKSASISGANLSEREDETLPNWFWGIKPLYMGDYNLEEYYNALMKIGYSHPLVIHTFGIIKNFGLHSKDHIPQSLDEIDLLAGLADCIVTGSENDFETSNLSIYPNPSNTGEFHLNKILKWKVVSPQGTQVLEGESSIINLSENA